MCAAIRTRAQRVQTQLVHGVRRTCAETAAVSRGISHVTTKQYTTSVRIKKRAVNARVMLVTTVTHSKSHATRVQ